MKDLPQSGSVIILKLFFCVTSFVKNLLERFLEGKRTSNGPPQNCVDVIYEWAIEIPDRCESISFQTTFEYRN